jgi:two-component system, NtrC family, response regulator HydG
MNLTLKPSIEQEYEIILKALEKTNFNKTKAAELLGVTRQTIHEKIKKYNDTLKGNK